ncbi:sulfite exporter TauE/SafE family protein [Alkalihalobacillus sp. MEB130]|uniref:sulfite exporter TauE/SafE family protein n=1 Tax=Alkalihalobacillus sp. MEB130 TaxID=2976704 RepID=UPI0028DE436D|nr:sulfite exporter TauE/SafE family protein [Alkalihalobacillus sp. MEB130]MDT8858680.1 sulfite exporter TauE/SafE family protein [Alkalihalobacillus sp. MEB130]
MLWIILVLVGLIGGTLGSLMGLGGGIVVVPALLMLGSLTLLEITPQVAVGTSLLIMIFTGISATIAYMKQKKVDYKSGLLFFSASGPGAIVGTWLNRGFDASSFQIYLGLFILFVSFILFIRKYLKPLPRSGKGIERTYTDEAGTVFTYGYRIIPVLAIAFVVGMLSGLFGIGGGSLLVPAMIVLFAFPPHLAVATSMFIILLSAVVGSISHIIQGNVDWLYAVALLPGAWFGGTLGAAINRRLSSEKVVFVLRFMLIVMAFRLIYEGWTM